MTGLEKIIACIGAEARERARGILQEAEEDCRRMASEYAERCESTRERMKELTLTEGEALIEQTRLAVEKESEEKLAAVREQALDRVFAAACEELHSTDYGKYREFLTAFLVSALLEQHSAEREMIARGETPESVDCLAVQMNGEDRARFGRAVIDGARRAVSRRIGKEKIARLQLSEEELDINGGVVLCCGTKRYDYSLETMLAKMREELAEKLLAMLFEA